MDLGTGSLLELATKVIDDDVSKFVPSREFDTLVCCPVAGHVHLPMTTARQTSIVVLVASCCKFAQAFSLTKHSTFSGGNLAFVGVSQHHSLTTSTSLFQSSTQLEQQETSSQSSINGLQHKHLFGGDFCGLSASFSATTGQRLPIPDHWIPPSLQEWGQVPSCLEVLVSEELQPLSKIDQNHPDDESKSVLALQRQTITILPETGCAVDNLETIRTEIQSIVNSWNVWPVLENKCLSSSIGLTSVAALATESAQPDPTDDVNHQVVHNVEVYYGLDDDGSSDSHYRVRVQLQVTASTSASQNLSPTLQLNAPVQIHLERQCNTTSSQGSRADGGGLDGRTVSQLMGNFLRKQQGFAEKQPMSFVSQQLSATTPSADGGTTSLLTLALPANVTIAILELSHQRQVLDVAYGQIDDPIDGAGSRLLRTLVRFSFPTSGSVEARKWSETFHLSDA